MVIAIIAVLIALLLPAVQAARAAARRLQCVEQPQAARPGHAQLSQHDRHLPDRPAWGSTAPVGDPGYPGDTSGGNHRRTWAWLILPYIEQGGLFSSINFSKSYQRRPARQRHGR